jgi:hypothetical protein
MKHTLIAVLAGMAVAAAPAVTSEKIDPEINAKTRAEAEKNSQIMRTMHYLTDVHGPRLTGSPNYQARRRMDGEADDRVGLDQRCARAVRLRQQRWLPAARAG